MTRKRILLAWTAALIFSACSPHAASGGAPQAWIDDPLDGARLPLQPYTISFHSSDPAGISRMEVSVNGEVLATLPNPESSQLLVYLTRAWEPQKPGRYVIRVRAQAMGGSWSEPDLVTVEIEEATPTPEITLTPTATVTPTITPTQVIGLLREPVINPQQINLPYDCGTTAIAADAQLTNAKGVSVVMLFYRVTDHAYSVWSDWAVITMNPAGGNAYHIQFDPILAGKFKPWVMEQASTAGWEGWLQTQIVIKDSKGALTHSPVYSLVKLGGCH